MMFRKIISLLLILCMVAPVYGAAVTSAPYDGTGWNTGAPNNEALVGNTYQEIQDLRKGVGIRYDKEHIDAASSSVGGEHLQGSARMFYLATASIPALQPDGTALAATDNGMLWHDITTDYIYALDDYSDPTVDGGWLSIGTLLGDVDVGASKFTVAAATGNTLVVGTFTVTGESTFNNHINLGAGDDLIGSATSDITINTNKFTVAGDTGNTLVAGTLDVTGNIDPTTYETTNGGFQNSDTMASAGDDKVASSDSIVKYATLDAGGVLMHDAEGGFNNADVDSTKTKVYTKYFTGNLDADSETNVAHGVTLANILHVSAACWDDTGSHANNYVISDVWNASTSASQAFILSYDTDTINFTSVGTVLQGNPYRIRVDYML